MPTCRPKSQEDGARPFLDSQSSVMNTAMPLDLRTKGIRRGAGPQPQAKQSAAGGSYSSVLVLVKWGPLFPTGLSGDGSLGLTQLGLGVGGTIQDRLCEASAGQDNGSLLLRFAGVLLAGWILPKVMGRQLAGTESMGQHVWEGLSHRNTSLLMEVALLSVLMTTEPSVALKAVPSASWMNTLLRRLPCLAKLRAGLGRELWVHSNCLQCGLLLHAYSACKTQKASKEFAALTDTTARGQVVTLLYLTSTFPSMSYGPHSQSSPQSPVTLGRFAAP